MSEKRVVVGMSGGVDSSVAAYLLLEAGYEVIGVTMKLWDNECPDTQGNTGGCSDSSAAADARRVAKLLGIPHYVIDFKEEFRKKVVQYFMDEYLSGRTPNPCIICNCHIKWEALMQCGMNTGADYIATGHYSRIVQLPNGRYAIRQSSAPAKDQSYALYKLTQQQLAHTLMPLGEYEKTEIRRMAEKIGLEVAGKPDSMEICFVPDGDYAGYIDENSGKRPPEGNFVTADGTVIGKHKGITHYTIGQRKGLNLSMGRPVFVTGIRPETNEIVIGDNSDILTTRLVCSHLNYMAAEDFVEDQPVIAKIRYNHKGARAKIRKTGNGCAEVLFDEPVRAVTPGQAVVFYDGEYVLGGGTIEY